MFTTPPVAALIVLLGCGGIRFQARLFALERQRATRSDDQLRTLIVGSGNAGAALARELTSGITATVASSASSTTTRCCAAARCVVCACSGHRRARAHLRGARHRPRLIALPNADAKTSKQSSTCALTTDAQVKVLPRASDLIGGPLLSSFRDIDLADLLGREHAPVDLEEIADYLAGATVLVTGAGGSIGSEIARQVARFKPGRLLLLDRDETLLHETVSDDLADAEPVLADIRDRPRIRAIFERYRPDVVFHAAAHKHVPILERHPAEAVHTNLLGTWWLATHRGRIRMRTLRPHLDRQGRRTRARSWARRSGGRVGRAPGRRASTTSHSPRCGSATCSAVAAAWCRRSCARSWTAVPSR